MGLASVLASKSNSMTAPPLQAAPAPPAPLPPPPAPAPPPPAQPQWQAPAHLAQSQWQAPEPNVSAYGPRLGPYRAPIYNKLRYICQVNKLDGFYSDSDLQKLADEVSRHDFDALARKMSFPGAELAIELVAVALYDVVILADDSGSMMFDKERIEDLNFIVSQVSSIATMFDSDGISMRTFNGSASFDNLNNADAVDKAIAKIKFSGGTPMGASLRSKIVEPMVIKPAEDRTLRKPVFVIVITDGQPDAKRDVVNAISLARSRVAATKYGPSAVGFQFAQVGKDKGAQQWLSELDSDPDIGKLVDTTSYFEHEQEECKKKGVDLTPFLWTLKLLMGAIDPAYDEQDES